MKISNSSSLFHLLLITFFVSGCATLVSDTTYKVPINANQENVQVTINNNGRYYKEVITPATVSLPAGDGFFIPSSYTFEFKKEGYKCNECSIKARLNGWYLGNFFIGGLLGLLIVDPASGAMWRLDYEDVYGHLTPIEPQPPVVSSKITKAPLVPTGTGQIQTQSIASPAAVPITTSVTITPTRINGSQKSPNRMEQVPVKPKDTVHPDKMVQSPPKPATAPHGTPLPQQPIEQKNVTVLQKQLPASQSQKILVQKNAANQARKSVSLVKKQEIAPQKKSGDNQADEDILLDQTILRLKKLREEKIITEEEYQTLLLKAISSSE